MRIGVTGSEGLIGWHVRAYFRGVEGVELRPADLAEFATPEQRRAFVRGCDAVIHLAGMNRGPDDEVYRANVRLARELIEACEAEGATPHVVFSSSTHIYRDTLYGRSKRECSELFAAWAARSGARFANMILPHVFGEGQKPFYNSTVSTFCWQLANRQEPTIIKDSMLELVHAQEVARKVQAILAEGTTGDVAMPGAKMMVGELLARLKSMAALYAEAVVPDLREGIALQLFNAYRSYLFPAGCPITPVLNTDSRGSLFEAVKTLNGGQAFFSTTHPGISRGNHYHLRKFERFCVVGGEAVIRLRKLFSEQVHEFRVSGDRPQFVDMPTLHTHEITNAGAGELTTLFWSSEIYDRTDPDTFSEKVRP